MSKWFVLNVQRNQLNGDHLIQEAIVAGVIVTDTDGVPYDKFDAICAKNPDQLFYLTKAELFGIGVVKTDVVKTKCN